LLDHCALAMHFRNENKIGLGEGWKIWLGRKDSKANRGQPRTL
jgi:hypothetical protein